MSQATIVRARQKALEDLPEWKFCCEAVRKIVEKQGQLLVQVDTRTLMVADSLCVHCGNVQKDVKTMKTTKRYSNGNGRFFNVIAVDCFDFDEGPAEATHDH